MRVTQTILFACIVLASVALPATAATYYVGACKAGSYPTISAAVNDPKVVAGSTINVCPGTYNEQVFISKSLNLQGVVSGNFGAATITGSAADQTFQTTVFPAVIRPSIVISSATVIITNDRDTTTRNLIRQYARRMTIEQRLAEIIRAFCADALSIQRSFSRSQQFP